jgi:hypothetical protein
MFIVVNRIETFFPKPIDDLLLNDHGNVLGSGYLSGRGKARPTPTETFGRTLVNNSYCHGNVLTFTGSEHTDSRAEVRLLGHEGTAA